MAEERDLSGDAIAPQGQVPVNLLLGARGSLYPASEAEYWRMSYATEPYFQDGREFEDYAPAYELGWTGYHTYGGEFDTANRVMANDWIVGKGVSCLSWEEARPACRAAWQRAQNAIAYTTDGSAGANEVLEVLMELADNARDAEHGYVEAAQLTQTPSLRALFERRSQSCRDNAAELQAQIERLGGEANATGTVTGKAHRVWLQVRGLFGAGEGTLLAECERGEDASLASYRKALQQNLPPEIHAMAQRQFEAAQRHHDMIRSLREQTREPAQAEPGQAA